MGYFSTFIFTACERPEVEIVEYDDSYSLDEKFIKVDIPKETDYDPNNYFKVEGKQEVILATNIVDGKGNMVNKEIPLVIDSGELWMKILRLSSRIEID